MAGRLDGSELLIGDLTGGRIGWLIWQRKAIRVSRVSRANVGEGNWSRVI